MDCANLKFTRKKRNLEKSKYLQEFMWNENDMLTCLFCVWKFVSWNERKTNMKGYSTFHLKDTGNEARGKRWNFSGRPVRLGAMWSTVRLAAFDGRHRVPKMRWESRAAIQTWLSLHLASVEIEKINTNNGSLVVESTPHSHAEFGGSLVTRSSHR